MKKWAIALLALLVASPLGAEEKFGGNSGSYVTPPIASGQIIVSGPDGTFAWYTLGGGNGNCYIQINGPGSASLICPNFGGGGGHQVPGGPPQFIGYSTTDQNEAVTSVGDVTYQRTGPNTYTATVNSISATLPSLQVDGPVAINGPLSVTGQTTVNNITGAAANFTTVTATNSITTANAIINGVLNFGPSGSLYFNGFPMGGTCPDGQFVNTISARGVPSCAEPPSGGAVTFVGNAPPPNPVEGLLWFNTVDLQTYIWYNDGTSSQWVAIVNLVPGGGGGSTDNPVFTGVVTFPDNSTWTNNMVYIADSTTLNVGGPAIFSNTATFNGAVNFNGALTIGGVPIAQLFAPLVNPAGGQNNYAPINNPAFTGTVTIGGLPVTTGGPYLPVTSATGPPWTVAGSVNFQSGISLGTPLAIGFGGTQGATASAARVNLVVPQIRVGGTAPATGNANGDFWYDSANATGLNIYLTSVPGWVPVTQSGGPWLPVNNPTYTGTLSSGNGPISVPNSIITAGQIVTPLLTVNGPGTPSACFPDGGCWTSSGIYLLANSTSNYSSFLMGPNTDNGTVYASLSATNGSFAVAQGAHLTASQWIADATSATGIGMGSGNGSLTLSGGTGLTGGAPFTPSVRAIINGNGATWNVPLFLNATASNPGSQVYWGSGPPLSGTYGSIYGQSGAVNIASGAYVNSSIQWVPTTPQASLIALGSQNPPQVAVYVDAGLTPGTPYGPTEVASFTPMANGNGGLQVNNYNGGTNAVAAVIASNGAATATLSITGQNFSSNPAFGPNTTVLGGTGGPMDFVAYNGVGPIKFWTGIYVGQFTATGDGFQGLELGGYAGRVNGNSGNTSLSIGNIYVSSTLFATGGISGAAFYNGNTWVADGGAGGGVALIQLQGTCIGMWNAGALGAGAAVPWTQIYDNCGSGESITHISNLQSGRIPTITSGILAKGSRDSFGWITNITGGQTTITFAEPFEENSTCTITPSSSPMVWFNANQSALSDTFVCYDPTTGHQCGDGQTLEYHCFGQAGREMVKAP